MWLWKINWVQTFFLPSIKHEHFRGKELYCINKRFISHLSFQGTNGSPIPVFILTDYSMFCAGSAEWQWISVKSWRTHSIIHCQVKMWTYISLNEVLSCHMVSQMHKPGLSTYSNRSINKCFLEKSNMWRQKMQHLEGLDNVIVLQQKCSWKKGLCAVNEKQMHRLHNKLSLLNRPVSLDFFCFASSYNNDQECQCLFMVFLPQWRK